MWSKSHTNKKNLTGSNFSPAVIAQDEESPGKEMYGSKQFLHTYNLGLLDLFQVSIRNVELVTNKSI